MKILLNEIRKILRPSVIAVVLVIYVIVTTTVGPLAMVEYKFDRFNGEYNMEEEGGILIETMVADMLMQRYGMSLEGDELYDFINYQNEYSANIDKVVSENEYCKKYGITSAEELGVSEYDILGSEYYVRDSEGHIKQLKEDAVSEFFENAYYKEFEYNGNIYIPAVSEQLKLKVYNINNGFETSGKDYVYYVYDSNVVNILGMDMSLLLCTALVCSMLAMIPYGVRDMRIGIGEIQHSSKVGRSIYLYKTAAVLISSAVFIAMGIAIAIVYYRCTGTERFDSMRLDSYYGAFGGCYGAELNRVYSGITMIDLIKVFSLSVFIFGIALCGGAHLVCEKCPNPITAAAACIPFFAILIFCGYRYLFGCVSPINHFLLFKGEGFVVLGLFTLAYISAVIFDYVKLKRKSY